MLLQFHFYMCERSLVFSFSILHLESMHLQHQLEGAGGGMVWYSFGCFDSWPLRLPVEKLG